MPPLIARAVPLQPDMSPGGTQPLFAATPGGLSRISMSLPEALLTRIDRLVVRRGFPSRSHAMAVILNKYLAEHREISPDESSTGTITLLHGDSHEVTRELGLICGRCQSEIKSRTSVAVADGQTLDVLLVQGPRSRLRALEQELERLRGVVCAQASLFAAIAPEAPRAEPEPSSLPALSA